MSSWDGKNTAAEALILRAELFHHGRAIIAHTLELDATSAFVRTDESLTNGDRLIVRLSFPGLLAPLDLEGHVASVRLASGPGQPQGVTLALVFASEREEQEFAELLAGKRPAGDEEAVENAGFRALLVEDSAMIREMVQFGGKKYFRSRPGYLALDFATNGEQAWRTLSEQDYRLAIVDYYLPGMNGAELVRRIRSDPRLSQLPVVAISIGGNEARDAFLEAGADIFLDKPVVVRDLFGTIERLTARVAAEAEASSDQRVLLMDDSPLFLDMARAALEQAGFTVLCANTLEELEAQSVRQPHLVLMDVQMPEAFGDDVAMVMRAARGVNVPIYLLSSLADDDLRKRVMDAEIDGYISKNAGVEELVTRVRTILQKASV